jgi:hypothetical protein
VILVVHVPPTKLGIAAGLFCCDIRERVQRVDRFHGYSAFPCLAVELRGDMSGEIIVINRATRDFPPHSYWLEDHGKSSRLQLQRIDM